MKRDVSMQKQICYHSHIAQNVIVSIIQVCSQNVIVSIIQVCSQKLRLQIRLYGLYTAFLLNCFFLWEIIMKCSFYKLNSSHHLTLILSNFKSFRSSLQARPLWLILYEHYMAFQTALSMKGIEF